MRVQNTGSPDVIRLGFLVSLIFADLCSHDASAATVCVANSAELALALDNAQINDEPNEIRLQRGNYALAHISAPTNPHSLSIIGGFNNDCEAMTINPSATSWGPDDGTDSSRVLDLIQSNGNILVSNLRVHGFDGAEYSSSFRAMIEGHGTITLENMLFDQNNNLNENVLLFNSDQITLRNVIAIDNRAPAAIRIMSRFNDVGGPGVHDGISLVNLTVAHNDGIGIAIDTASSPLLVNSIVFFNAGVDVSAPSSPIAGFSNILGADALNSNIFTASSEHNVSTDPHLDDAYRPLKGSPAIAAGLTIHSLTPSTDAYGCPRGMTPAIGAIESGACGEIFGSGFE